MGTGVVYPVARTSLKLVAILLLQCPYFSLSMFLVQLWPPSPPGIAIPMPRSVSQVLRPASAIPHGTTEADDGQTQNVLRSSLPSFSVRVGVN